MTEDTIAGLRADVQKLTAAAVELEKGRRSNRRWILALAVVAAVLIVFGVVLWRVVVAVRHNTSSNEQTRRAGIVACQASNDARAQNAALWNHFLALIVPPHPDAVTQAKVTDLRASIAATYAARDCTKLAAGTIAPTPTR